MKKCRGYDGYQFTKQEVEIVTCFEDAIIEILTETFDNDSTSARLIANLVYEKACALINEKFEQGKIKE